jgi:hypothetical protein
MIELPKDAKITFTGCDGEPVSMSVSGISYGPSPLLDCLQDIYMLKFLDITEEVYGRRESCTQEFKLEIIKDGLGRKEEEDHEKRLYEIYKKGLDLL